MPEGSSCCATASGVACSPAPVPFFQVEKYVHHGVSVFVMTHLKGGHRQDCLCWTCGRFHPSRREKNCPIASKLYEICVEHNVVTPVRECPLYLRVHRMLFINPEVNPPGQLNITVRDGRKWANQCRAGDLVEIVETPPPEGMIDDMPVLHQALVKHVTHFVSPLLIPEGWLGSEHAEACRTLEGLGRAMRDAYGPDWGREDGITVVGFEILPKDQWI